VAGTDGEHGSPDNVAWWSASASAFALAAEERRETDEKVEGVAP